MRLPLLPLLQRLRGNCSSCGLTSSSESRHDKPTIAPFADTDIPSAAGTFGNPGIVMMSPALATTKPAPAEPYTSLTVIRKPVGLPSRVGSSVSEYCVFAMHTGVFAMPIDVRYSIDFSAAAA